MPNVQQANLRALVKNRVPKGKVSETARQAGMAPSTLQGFLDGNAALGELSALKLSKILGPEIEHLFYNEGYEPAKANTQSGAEDAKDKAIREIESLIGSVDDPGRRLQIINIVRATARAAVDEYAREGGAGDVDAGAARRAGRGGDTGAGAGADVGEVRGEPNTGL